MIERTFAMIKPDAVAAHTIGKIIDMIERNGFTILRLQLRTLSKPEVEKFYAIHKERPFFPEIVAFMTSGPSVLMVLEKDNAIKAWRDLMGATDPKKAAPGTVRALYGTNTGSNATHGSDAPETAITEIKQFFPELA
jgi:nucleoside-diphosphate kinase